MKLTPESIPQVALDFMNRDHGEFVLLRDKLLDLLADRAPVEQLQGALDELAEHTRRHFVAEEQVMLETGFPAYQIHKGEHDSVLAEMAAQVEHWQQGHDNESLRSWIDQGVGDWLLAHVGSMDFVTAHFISTQQKGR